MPPLVWELSGLIDRLNESGFEAIIPVFRGILPSTAPESPYSVEDLASDVAEVVGSLGLGSTPRLLGYSLGGFVAQQLLLSSPSMFGPTAFVACLDPSPLIEILDKMELGIIESTGALDTSVSTFELLMTTLPPSELQQPTVVRQWASLMDKDTTRWSGIEGLKGQLEASKRWTEEGEAHLEDLRRIDSTCLSVAFEYDVFFPPATQAAAARRIGNCEHVDVPDAAHGGLHTHPQQSVGPIVDFFERQLKLEVGGRSGAQVGEK